MGSSRRQQPANWLYPTAPATRIAASFRASLPAPLQLPGPYRKLHPNHPKRIDPLNDRPWSATSAIRRVRSLGAGTKRQILTARCSRPKTRWSGRAPRPSPTELHGVDVPPHAFAPGVTAARDPPSRRAAARPLSVGYSLTPWGTGQPRSGRLRRSGCASAPPSCLGSWRYRSGTSRPAASKPACLRHRE